ncbi:hypothetical protein ABEV81_06500 [Bacillus paranthracis]
MEMKNKKSYAIIPNVAFGFGTEYHLSDDEFMMFVHLQFMKQIGLENTIVTMIDMLVAGLEWNTSTKSRDKKRVVDALRGLESKGYIIIAFKEKITRDILTITINKEMENREGKTVVDWKEKPFIFKGYTRISYDKYNLAESNGQHLMIIAYITWRENAKFIYRIAYKEWESILNVSDKTARDKIAECASFITKITGDGYLDEQGQYKQEANTYEITTRKQTPSVASKVEKTEEEFKKLAILENEIVKVTDKNVLTDEGIFKQIFDKNTKWRFNGYKIWKETTCPHVKQAGQKKIDAMRKSPNTIASEVADRLEREYQEHLEYQKKQSEWFEAMETNQKSDDLFWEDGGGEWTSSYKKTEKSNFDFTDFLDD